MHDNEDVTPWTDLDENRYPLTVEIRRKKDAIVLDLANGVANPDGSPGDLLTIIGAGLGTLWDAVLQVASHVDELDKRNPAPPGLG